MSNLRDIAAPPRAMARSVRPTKLQQVLGDLNALVRLLGPGEKLPTMRDLQGRLGTTSATLDSALNRLEAAGLIQRRHGVGVFVSPHLNRRSVALVCNPFVFQMAGASPFWSVLVEQAGRRAEDHHEAFSLHFTLPNDAEGVGLQPGLIERVRNGRVDGVLLVGAGLGAVEWLAAQEVPTVAYAGYAPCAICQDSDALVDLGVAALAERGCRRIALWSPLWPHVAALSEEERRQNLFPDDAFRRALEQRGLPFDPDLFRNNAALAAPGGRVPSPQEQGYAMAQAVFCPEKGVKPDGIVLTDDMLTQGALVGLQRAGIEPGRDVQIATHANKGISVFVGHDQGLVRIEYDPADIADAMFHQLEVLLEGRTPAEPLVSIRPRVSP